MSTQNNSTPLHKKFFDEIIATYETVSGIEARLGWEVIVDMWYFSNALMQGDAIDVHEPEAGILIVINSLPSAQEFMSHVNKLYVESKIKP